MIEMNDFASEPAALRQAMLSAVTRVLASGRLILGKEVESFEREWASLCRAPYGIGVGNGMDAIEIGLRALGIGHGDEVITTPMTAFATVLAILKTGATPVLADIDPRSALLSYESVQRCLSPRTRALVLVHLYGQLRDIDDWVSFCNQHGIELVEDCAQSHLAKSKGRPAGSFGSVGAFSFYPTKNLGAAGDAGMLITRREDVRLRAMALRNYGQSRPYYHSEIGLNSRLDEIHAAMLSERLKWLPEFNQRRCAIANSYQHEIKNQKITLSAQPEDPESHVYHLFVVTTPERERLQTHLLSLGIRTLVHYPVPVHKQPPCIAIRRDPEGLPYAERHAVTCLSLPCHPQLSDRDVLTIVDALNAY